MVLRGRVSVRRLLRVAAAVVVMLAAGVVGPVSPAAASGTTALYAWGINDHGEVGLGYTSDWVSNPTVVGRINSPVVQAASAPGRSMVLLADGTVWGWGQNGEGQLGDGTTTDSLVPVRVPNLDHIVSIAAGEGHGVAVRDDGSVWTWGNNNQGQLGNGTTSDSYLPVKLAAPTGVIKVAAGTTHTLALRANGEVWAWGNNSRGQLGIGSTGGFVSTPVRASTPYGIAQIAASGHHSIAMRTVSLGGSVWTWGDNTFGEVGDNTTTDRNTPVLVLRDATSIGLDTFMSFAVGSDGFMYSWGDNFCGGLGNGTSIQSHVPRKTTLGGVVSATGGAGAGVAVRTDGTLWRWGYQPGTNCQNPAVGVPVQVPGLTSVRSAANGRVGAFLVVADAPSPLSTVAVPGAH